MERCARRGGERAGIKGRRRRGAGAGRSHAALILSVVLFAGLGGCEKWNRATFRFNEVLDDVVIAPVTRVYEFVFPGVVRTAIRNIFATFETTGSMVNSLLQGKFEKAGQDASRVLVNATLGVAGIFDVATKLDIPQNDEDFGQTLGVWGFGSGRYVVLPFFGPSSVRDSLDIPFSLVTNPLFYLDKEVAQAVVFGMRTVDGRSNADPQLRRMQESAVDPYTFVRESYLQRREYKVRDGEVPPEDLPGVDLDELMDLPAEEMEFEEDAGDAGGDDGGEGAPERGGTLDEDAPGG